jgi:hypothetical protein
MEAFCFTAYPEMERGTTGAIIAAILEKTQIINSLPE